MPRRDEFPIIKSYAQDKVKEERKKWKQAIEDIKAEIEAKNTSIEDFADTHGWVNGLTNEHNAHEADLAIIDKHTKELMK